MKRLPTSIVVVLVLVAVFLLQERIAAMPGLFAARPGEPSLIRCFSSLLLHGSILHLAVNCASLIILLHGFSRRIAFRLLLLSVLPAAVGIKLYADLILPAGAVLLGSSPALFALFAIICWRERHTSKFAFFGLEKLAVNPLPALAMIVVLDAAIWSSTGLPVAWQAHTMAAAGGLGLALFFSIEPAKQPRTAMAVVFLSCAVSVLLSGCVAGNKAEINAVKIERRSTANEVDQYVTTAGRVARFLGLGGAAE
jgi:membrane associated rhomboid family serine protease